MATFTKINDWIRYYTGETGNVDMDNDKFVIALSNTAPSSETNDPTADGNGIRSNVTQIAYTNYSDDLGTDRVLEGVTHTFSGGTFTFDFNNFTITASGGDMNTFRYLYVYDNTATSDPLIAVFDLGREITLRDTDSADIVVDAGGLFTVN